MKLSILFFTLLWANSSAFACDAPLNFLTILPPLHSSMNASFSLNQAWQLKLSVRAQMKKDYKNGALTRACADQYKKYFIDLRSYEDRVAVLGINKGMKTADSLYTPNNKQLNVASGQTMKDVQKDLQSGDIILSRGNAFTSAAISHLGDSEQQFSHMSLVYKDPKTGLLYTTEAHIELGVIARPIQANIDENNSRGTIFRFQDPNLAHRAAQYAYRLADSISTKTGANINYDFAMNMKENDNLFCSEVASNAFNVASRGTVQIPMFKSDLTSRHLAFQEAIDIHQTDSFLPADIEIDPRFTMIAEWKDWARVRDLFEKDAISRSVFNWMDTLNYRFDQSGNGKVWFRKNIGWTMRRTPLIQKLVEDKMPLNMSRNLLGLFTVLDQTGEPLQRMLAYANDYYIRKSGGLLPDQEWMMRILERVRQDDEKAEDPLFHQYFSP